MKDFGLLAADQIECRQSRVTDKCVELLLYKTARTDANVLDSVVGSRYWENDFRTIDGVLFGGIGIDFDHNGKMVWKWDAGSESNVEKEKGEASDAFKRAGSKWGIGRELYTSPKIRFWANQVKMTGGKCYDTFTVTEIEYDAAESISFLRIVDEETKNEFVYGTRKDGSRPAPVKNEVKQEQKAETKQEQKPEATQGEETIGKQERKLAFDLAAHLHNESANAVVKDVIATMGYENTVDIPRSRFSELMQRIKDHK